MTHLFVKVLIAAKYGGHNICLDKDFEFGVTEKSKEFLSKFPLGKVPALELQVTSLIFPLVNRCLSVCYFISYFSSQKWLTQMGSYKVVFA